MKFAIYCRKSTDTEDKQVLSLESQESELLEIAKRENLDIITVFKESRSAKEPGRPVFNKIMGMLAMGEIDGILCWKIDRLTRNPVDGGQIQWLLQTGKIKCIVTFEKKYYPADNVLLLNIEQAMATQYIRDLSVNVKRGNRAKLERGDWPSPAPFGYLNEKGSKTIKINKKTGRYVLRAFQLYALGGYTMKELSDILYKEGLRTAVGGKLHKSKIHKFFRNKFYCGLMERDGKMYHGNHKPIIPLALFEQVQDVLHNRKHPKPKKHFYSARGFLSCASCTCTLTADTQKGFIYYYCTNGKGSCTQHKTYMRSEHIDKLIATLFLELKFDIEFIELMAAAYKQKNQVKDNYIQASLDKLTNGAKSLLEKELALVDGFSAGLIREELYTLKMKDIGNKRAEFNVQIEEIKTKGGTSMITFEQVKNLFIDCNKASELYLEASEPSKRNILQNLLSNACIENQNIVSYQFKSPFDLIAKAPKNGDFATMRALWDDIRTALVTNTGITSLIAIPDSKYSSL